MKKKTVAIVPAFNEEKTISTVIKNLKSYVDRVIVVDDFSTDKTYKIAIKSNAITLRNKKNLGPDKSIEVGLKKAKRLKYEFILTFDADDQHPHHKIPFFLNLLYKNKADIVVGNREKFPRFSEYFFSYYSNFKIGVPDPINGFKAFKNKIISKIGYFDSYNSLTSQILFNSYKNNYKIKNIKIKVKKRIDSPRIGGVIKANYKVLRSLILTIVKNI